MSWRRTTRESCRRRVRGSPRTTPCARAPPSRAASSRAALQDSLRPGPRRRGCGRCSVRALYSLHASRAFAVWHVAAAGRWEGLVTVEQHGCAQRHHHAPLSAAARTGTCYCVQKETVRALVQLGAMGRVQRRREEATTGRAQWRQGDSHTDSLMDAGCTTVRAGGDAPCSHVLVYDFVYPICLPTAPPLASVYKLLPGKMKGNSASTSAVDTTAAPA